MEKKAKDIFEEAEQFIVHEEKMFDFIDFLYGARVNDSP